MNRRLTATIFLIGLGLAFAQPPTDYTLLCGSEVAGAVSYVDGELHVALDEGWTSDEGWTCDGTLTVEQDAELKVEIDVDADTGEVTVTLVTEGDTDADPSGVAETLPEEDIAGMVTAQENRAMAAKHRADAEAKADAARERGENAREEAAEESESEDLPETPDDAPRGPEAAEEHLPENLPQAPDDAPDGPEAAVEHANEVSGGAVPAGAGEGRP